MSKQITYEQIAKLGPCGLYGEEDGENYTPSRIRQLMGGREFVTPQEIHDHGDVPWEDKYWLLSKLLPEREQHELACRVALTCEIEDDELRAKRDALIQAKRDWLAGKISDVELDAYWDVGRAAYLDAYWDADRDADRSAYRAAYLDAYWAVGRDAARAAYRAVYCTAYCTADRYAARAAAYNRFCDIALEMMLE